MTVVGTSDGVQIHAAVLRDINAHAHRVAPEECCGLLIGTGTRIESAYPARNLQQSSSRYLIDPADHFAAIRASRRNGRAVVGAYHSHPATAAVPSPTDEREANDPEFLYLIVSLVGAETRGFRLVDGRLRGVDLRVLPDATTT